MKHLIAYIIAAIVLFGVLGYKEDFTSSSDFYITLSTVLAFILGYTAIIIVEKIKGTK